MATTFNADEVFEIAERIEVNGGKFYRRAAELVKDSAARDVMLRLAAMEDQHQSFFGKLREEAAKPDGTEWTIDPDGEGAAYLKAIADGQVFDVNAEVTTRFKESDSAADILRAAIGFEKDTIIFFLGIKNNVPSQLGKDKIEALIKEEQDHIIILSNTLSGLK